MNEEPNALKERLLGWALFRETKGEAKSPELMREAAERIAWGQDRIELLERTLRDCLESLEWYAWKAGHNDPRGLTPSPTSVIGQARALVRKCANCGQDKYAHPVSPELQCPEFAYFVKR